MTPCASGLPRFVLSSAKTTLVTVAEARALAHWGFRRAGGWVVGVVDLSSPKR